MKNKTGKILTVQEVSKILRVDLKTVYRLIGQNTLIAFKVGRVFRVDEKDFVAYLEAAKKKVRDSPPRSY